VELYSRWRSKMVELLKALGNVPVRVSHGRVGQDETTGELVCTGWVADVIEGFGPLAQSVGGERLAARLGLRLEGDEYVDCANNRRAERVDSSVSAVVRDHEKGPEEDFVLFP